jgi:hypothetical protein
MGTGWSKWHKPLKGNPMKRTSPIPKPGKEVVLQAANYSNAQVRLVVAAYYSAQENRKSCDNKMRHWGERDDEGEALPELLQYFADSNALIENHIKKSMAKFAEAHLTGRWALSLHGVGPCISAGCLAHIDIHKAPTVGHIWNFAGLNPARKWLKGEKRPYNAALKQICFHMSDCAKRASGSEKSYYGKLYKARKEMVVQRNEEGRNAERAKTYYTLSKDVKKSLAQGKLPDWNLDRQALNWTAKIFLSHFHAVLFWDIFGRIPPRPFAIQHLGHAHEIRIPNLDLVPGLEKAYYGPRAI